MGDTGNSFTTFMSAGNGYLDSNYLWRCVFCSNSDIKSPGKKVLPCLHFACTECLHAEIKLNSLPGGQAIVTCRECSYKTKVIDGDISCLKEVPLSFLNTDNRRLEQANCMKNETTLAHCCAKCFDADDVVQSLVHCNKCDMLLCETCREVLHKDHPITSLDHMIKTKKNYMEELVGNITAKIQRHHDKIILLDTVKGNVGKLKEELRADINNRAENLTTVINNRKETMLEDLEKTYTEYMTSYEENIAALNLEMDTMVNSYEFTSKVMEANINQDLLAFHNDINNRLTYLNHKIHEAKVEILNMELKSPEKGREESYAEKLFGSLIKGNVICGDAELKSSFHIDLQWPSSLAATNQNVFVVAGKTGAFESSGKLSFYDRQGVLIQEHEFCDGVVPCDVICGLNNCLWVSDNLGQISKFSSTGIVLDTWVDMFKGGGHLAMTPKEELLVSSMESKCVHKYDSHGHLVQSVPDSDSFKLVPHCIASNTSGDIIIADHQLGAVFVFDSSGVMQFKFGGHDSSGAILKCPSDVCSDPFNNILVSDFTNDRVILISKSGQFLGYLLTQDNGISCPNFITLDLEGHLFVGQYGGDIHVFRYLSYVKNA